MKYHYEDFYDHIKYILNYWEVAVDYENGGIHFCMNPMSPEPRILDYKCLLMHARQIYNFSVGAKHNIEGAETIAHHLYDTLDTAFESIDGLYKIEKIKNLSLYEPKGDCAKMYDSFYVVIGLSKYASVFCNQEAYRKAKKLFFNSMEKANDGEYKENGCFAYYDFNAKSGKQKNGNTFLHHAEATVNLLCCAKSIFSNEQFIREKEEVGKVLKDAHDFFANKFFNYEYDITPDGINDDLTISKYTMYFGDTLAHPMEWVGFWYEAEKVMEEELSFLREHGERVTTKCLQNAEAAKDGCFRNNFYLKQQLSSESSTFWSQSEAILNALFANKRYKTDYTQTTKKMLDFYFKYYIDRKFGGIFSRVDPKGLPTEFTKGFRYKCDHHSLRMCEKIIDYKLLD